MLLSAEAELLDTVTRSIVCACVRLCVRETENI